MESRSSRALPSIPLILLLGGCALRFGSDPVQPPATDADAEADIADSIDTGGPDQEAAPDVPDPDEPDVPGDPDDGGDDVGGPDQAEDDPWDDGLGDPAWDPGDGWDAADAAEDAPADDGHDGYEAPATSLDDDADGFCELGPCTGRGVVPGDCDDADPEVNPAHVEVCGNTIDDDCDGTTDVVDEDLDGHASAACGGADCDDGDPAVHPGLVEVRNGKDDDCDGTTDNGLVAAGDVVISEAMIDPGSPIADSAGEWVELTNVSAFLVDVGGWRIHDLEADGHVIAAGAGTRIPAGGRAILARNGDPLVNGGIEEDYDYTGLLLDNSADEIVLSDGTAIIDEVDYSTALGWPVIAGFTMNLSASLLTAVDNDLLGSWCNPPSSYSYYTGNRGTPRLVNVDCMGGPSIDHVTPSRGLASGGTTAVIYGTRLSAATAVTFGGVPAAGFTVVSDLVVSVTQPVMPPGRSDVVVTTPAGSFTLAGAFVATGTATAVEFCGLQWPVAISGFSFVPTGPILGTVGLAGTTDAVGPGAGIVAEAGYGPAGTDPSATPGWEWSPAAYAVDQGALDLFAASMTPAASGTYSVAYRASADGGVNWLYCDAGEGTADGFSTADLGLLTVP